MMCDACKLSGTYMIRPDTPEDLKKIPDHPGPEAGPFVWFGPWIDYPDRSNLDFYKRLLFDRQS